MANAVPMISRCFEHQHPDEFGREIIAPLIVPENSIRFEALDVALPDPTGPFDYAEDAVVLGDEPR